MIVSSVTIKDNSGALIADPVVISVDGTPVLGWLNGDPITVPDNVACAITVTKAGYIGFSNNFTFWTLPTDYPNMDIYLTESANPEDVKASFYAIRKPCSTDYCLYTTSSSNYSNIVWNWNDGSSDVYGFNVCKTLNFFGELNPTQTIIIDGIDDDTTSNTIVIPQFIPTISFTVTCPNEPPITDCNNAGIGTFSIEVGTCPFTIYS